MFRDSIPVHILPAPFSVGKIGTNLYRLFWCLPCVEGHRHTAHHVPGESPDNVLGSLSPQPSLTTGCTGKSNGQHPGLFSLSLDELCLDFLDKQLCEVKCDLWPTCYLRRTFQHVLYVTSCTWLKGPATQTCLLANYSIIAGWEDCQERPFCLFPSLYKLVPIFKTLDMLAQIVSGGSCGWRIPSLLLFSCFGSLLAGKCPKTTPHQQLKPLDYLNRYKAHSSRDSS